MANGMALMSGYSPMLGGAAPINPFLPQALTPNSLATNPTADMLANGGSHKALEKLLTENLVKTLPSKQPESKPEEKRNPLQLLTDVALNLSQENTNKRLTTNNYMNNDYNSNCETLDLSSKCNDREKVEEVQNINESPELVPHTHTQRKSHTADTHKKKGT